MLKEIETDLVSHKYDFSQFIKIVEVIENPDKILSFEILNKNPNLNSILFGSIEVINTLKEQTPQDLKYKCNFNAGDYLKFIPVGQKLYIFNQILSKHNDDTLISFFQNIHKLIPLYGRLIIIENLNSGRSESEFEILFKKALFLKTNTIKISDELSILEVLRL